MLTNRKTQKSRFFKNPMYPDPYTIDLRYADAQEYTNSRDYGIGDTILKFWVFFFALLGIGYVISQCIPIADAWFSARSYTREQRLEVCHEAYKASGIGKMYLYEQLPVVRCATYMSLVYAYESDFGQSRRCREDRNCWGMKGNGVDTPPWFLIFQTEKEWREYFAKKYFQWHYKKKIEQFVYGWSTTDRATYISFMRERYRDLYLDLELRYVIN